MTTWECYGCNTTQVSFKDGPPVKCIGCGKGSAFLIAVDRRGKEVARK
jgi:hypothetical protein